MGSTALICGVSPSQVTYVGETKTVAEVRRRLLEQVRLSSAAVDGGIGVPHVSAVNERR